jgi:signal transduction histidine kinase
MRGLSFRTKVFLLFAGAALLIVVPALVLIASEVEGRVYARATDDLTAARASLQNHWQSEDETLRERARSLSLDATVLALLAEPDSAGLRAYLARLPGRGREVLVADTTGVILAGPALDSATLRGGSGWGSLVTYTSNDSKPLRVALWPAVGDSGFIGVVGVGIRLDTTTTKSIKENTLGTDVALVVGDSLVATSLSRGAAAALRASELSAFTRGGLTEVGGISYLSRVYRLPTQGVPAAVVLFRPVQDELRIARGIWYSIVVTGFAALVLALLLAWLVARIVARPTQALAEAAARLARGDYRAPLPPAGTDEIGQLARAFGEMRAGVEEREARLRSAQAELIHREKLAAMGRLVAQLSHEINNPIYNIQNCLEALERRGRPDDPNREFLELAQEELARMAALTRQLLDQSRPVSDAARPLDLNSVARRVLALAATDLEAREVEVVLRLEPELSPVVAHPDAIQQVLANLVRNAVDAMPYGGVLTVETRTDGDQVEVLVEDTGGGIPDEHLPHIFEAFFTTKPGVTGIGLGLFVSEGIVRGHRGRLQVDSNPGAGSRFTLRLPREALAEPAAA